MTNAERVSRNFIKKRGYSAFRDLTDLLKQQAAGTLIAQRFGVSRERARQWKNALGTTITFYRVHPHIQQLAEEKDHE